MMRTVTKSLTAISLSCLEEGFDEEAADVENRAEKREKVRRDAMVYSCVCENGKRKGMVITRDRKSVLYSIHFFLEAACDNILDSACHSKA
jgi:hypothetical protein